MICLLPRLKLSLSDMPTIFNFINDILCYKKGDLLGNIDDESGYNNYMINRWVSMYSPQLATIVNYTSNNYYSILSAKSDHYKFLLSIIPKVKIFRIQYIKKQPKESEADEAITQLAGNLELSKRELIYYIESNNIDISRYNKLWEH